MPFPIPSWLEKMPEGPEKNKARTRFVIRLASLYCSQQGFIAQLSSAIGVENFAINNGITRWQSVPPWLCRRIEDSLGADAFPVEILNPEIFKAK